MVTKQHKQRQSLTLKSRLHLNPRWWWHIWGSCPTWIMFTCWNCSYERCILKPDAGCFLYFPLAVNAVWRWQTDRQNTFVSGHMGRIYKNIRKLSQGGKVLNANAKRWDEWRGCAFLCTVWFVFISEKATLCFGWADLRIKNWGSSVG